ncbi:hypothetical protein J3459_010137 [Metarhizium acridum]|nr:hypothetical protein J3459_010137 [Metarhizium acridum]
MWKYRQGRQLSYMASAARVSVSMHTLKILARIIAGLWASAGSTNLSSPSQAATVTQNRALINDSPSENVDKIPEWHRCSNCCKLHEKRGSVAAPNSPWVAERPAFRVGSVFESQQTDWTGLEE